MARDKYVLRKSYRENERVDSRENESIGPKKESKHERMSGSEKKNNTNISISVIRSLICINNMTLIYVQNET